VDEALAENPHLKFKRLPAYSPQLNPIERFWKILRLLAANPGSPGGRYDAACAAALAGCGQGKDAVGLGEQERARLRKQALDWLRDDLNAWRDVLEKGPVKARPVIVGQMQHWRKDKALAAVRGPEALASLPEAERPAWRKLWADVAATLDRANRNASAEKKSAGPPG
jgi:hypothetical protein